MSIQYAILGILSVEPMTGYDLKKIMQDSPFMHWSGNNNQIYKALLALDGLGYVTNETQHLEKAPSKKVYTVTETGLLELRKWIQENPEAPEFKNPFLVQLAWADMLSSEELAELLDCYEQRVGEQIALEKLRAQKGCFSPNRSARETVLWALIYDNILNSYASELQWITKARQKLASFSGIKGSFLPNKINSQEALTMTYQAIEKHGKKYILLEGTGKTVQSEQDALDIVSVCAQNNTNLVLIQSERLSEEFLSLSTGVAGAVLQKLTNYGIKAATVLNEKQAKGKFKLFAAESNQGNMFRIYGLLKDAEQWLLEGNK